MDARLWLINGVRATRLRRSDLPKVAQAIVDFERGRAEARAGYVRETAYVNLRRKNAYDVVIRGDDWAKIVPFLRNSSSRFTPKIMPPEQPPPVLSPQPNRVMQPPPPNPSVGQQSFLEGFDYATLAKIEALLTTTTVDALEGPSLPSKPMNPVGNGIRIEFPGLYAAPVDSLDQQQKSLYDRVLALLEQLFPEDFPTSPL